MDAVRRQSLRSTVERKFRDGGRVVSFLDACDFLINRIDHLNPNDIAINLAVGSRHRERLGLRSDEILMVCLNSKNQLQWFHKEIRTRLRASERLNRSAVIVLSRDPLIRDKCGDPRPDPDTGYLVSLVALTYAEAFKGIQTAFLTLEEAFHDQAFKVDHFAVRTPVIGDDLFGRRTLVSQLESLVTTEGTPVGLFGLRRAGKTSVLRQLLLQLQARKNPEYVIAVADLQIDNYTVDTERVAGALARDLSRAAKDMGSSFKERQHERAFDRVAALVAHLIKKGRRVLLAIDEVEWLIPPPTARDAENRAEVFLQVFGRLRGLKHQFGADLALLVCGINEYFAEQPSIMGYPNPVLDFFDSHYVAGLEPKEFHQMLQTIGSRMGVSFDPEFVGRAYTLFGGHAYLARHFCSHVVGQQGTRPLCLVPEMLDRHYETFLKTKWSIVTQIAEYFAHFYPEELKSLERLVDSSVIGDEISARHLQRYGLVKLDGNTAKVRIDCIARWVREREARSAARALSSLPERFEVVREVGSGATGTVYLVKDRILEEERALKHYHKDVALEAVLAEHAVIREVRSPFVVQAFDVVPGTDGSHFLVMEYVAGRDLETVLRECAPLDREQVNNLAYHLFTALQSIHPKKVELRKLLSHSSLNSFQGLDVQRLREEGFLHRDLKPQNIVVEDEQTWALKLIDLGLARRAVVAGRSAIGTPLYQPLNVGMERWDATFDLYALGAILLRALTGKLPHHEDLQAIIDGVDEGWQPFFRRALEQSKDARFSSVEEMKAAFERCSLG